ncbi:Gfo/Idh/MocA family oxidoreductase [Candidatus Dependentiae bacterium]|nr:Gfo/Idh/MocA family oxidoreductase [Candidatus Dependentiae bacterium]
MVKLGIIGLGHMGAYHASVCATIPTIELVAIADPNEKNWAKVRSGKVEKTKSFRDWIDNVDGVIIAVPTSLHYEVAKTCLERNKHLLLEKPLTKNLDQAKDLFAIASSRNLTLHAGHVERFNGAVQELKKLIHKPYLIESHRIGPFAARAVNETVVLDLMIHDLDIISNLVNAPVAKIHVIENKIKSNLSDIAAVQIQFENQTLANIISSRISHIKRRTMCIHQEGAFIELNFTTQDISIHRHTTASVNIGHNQMKYKQEATVEQLFVYKDNPLKLEIEHFVQSIKTGKNRTNATKDLDALRLTLEIEKALGHTHDSNHRGNWKPASTSV